MSELINRDGELQLIDRALDTLLDSQRLLRTPIVEFHGVEGIGKTILLKEVRQRCLNKRLEHLWLQKIENTKNDFIQPTNNILEKAQKGVVIVDSLDDLADEQLREFEVGLQGLLENRSLFVVLASRGIKKFDTTRSITRKLTLRHLQTLGQLDCQKYFKQFQELRPEFWETLYELTHGYPLAMDVAATAIVAQKLDPNNEQDRVIILSALKEKVIHERLLAKASSADHFRLETLLTLLSVPRRFNLAIMQSVVEEFAPPYKLDNTLKYIALPDEINKIATVLDWNLSRAGYCIDDPVRDLFLLKLRLEGLEAEKGNQYTYKEIHHFLAERNRRLADEVRGPDHVRYLEEWFYHLIESGEPIPSVEQKITDTIEQLAKENAAELLIKFHEEFKQDPNLNESLGDDAHQLQMLMSEHLERLKAQKPQILENET